jgi:hypothetical protein
VKRSVSRHVKRFVKRSVERSVKRSVKRPSTRRVHGRAIFGQHATHRPPGEELWTFYRAVEAPVPDSCTRTSLELNAEATYIAEDTGT